MIPLTANETKKLLPTRSLGNAQAPTPRSAKKLLKAFAGSKVERLKTYRKGCEVDVQPELRPLREEAVAIVAKPTLEVLAKASLDGLAVAECMFRRGHPVSSLAVGIALARGASDAVEVMCRSLQYGLEAEPNWTVAVFAVSPPPPRVHGRVERWVDLRHVVCSASEEEYQIARERASSWMDTLEDEAHQAALAFAFPDEPWAGALVDKMGGGGNQSVSIGGMPPTVQRFGLLMSAHLRTEQVARIAKETGGPFQLSRSALFLSRFLPAKELLPIFRDALPALLERKRYQTFHKTPPRDLLRAIFALEGDGVAPEVAKVARDYLGDRTLGSLAASYFEHTPDQCAVLQDGGPAAQRLFAQLQSAEKNEEHSEVLSATDERIPALLRDRAWRPPRQRKKPPVHTDLPIRYDGETRCTLGHRNAPQALKPLRGEGLKRWREHAAARGGAVDAEYNYQARAYFAVPEEEGLKLWNEGRGYVSKDVRDFVAKHGLRAVEGFSKRTRFDFLKYEGGEEWLVALESLVTPLTAMTWARLLLIKGTKARSRRFLLAHPAPMAAGLLPSLLSSKKSERTTASHALDAMMRAGLAEHFRAAARPYGDAVQNSIELLLARDLRVLMDKAPKPPEFLLTASLPTLCLRTGESVPKETSNAFIELLSVAPPDYVGWEEVRRALHLESVHAFVRTLVELWARHDGPGRSEWMMRAAVCFQSVDTTARLCELARAFSVRAKGPAVRLCAALTDIGDDSVLMHLGHIAATTRYKALREFASAQLQAIASARGLTPDELEDRSVPDLGLGPRGTLTLAFDGRSVEVRCSEELEILLFEQGKRLRSFPRGKSQERDDAKAKVDALRKSLRALCNRQIARAERALRNGRTWTAEDVQRYWLAHPLIRHLARGLVWSTAGQTFRLCDDGTLADVNDEEFQLGEGEVRIAHPLTMLDSLEQWRERFADYEILQPVDQLGRAMFRAEDEEGLLAAAEGNEVGAAKLKSMLERRGWIAEEGDYITTFRRVGEHACAWLTLEPGVDMQYLQSDAKAAVKDLQWRDSERDGATAIEIASVPPLLLSEVLRDLSVICGT